MGYFSPHYCAFEVIMLLRMLFFCAFNVINTYSIIFVIDDTKLRMYKAFQTAKKQKRITLAMENIYNLQSKVAKVSD